MKIVLAALNAKYIHSNLAVYSLKAYAAEYARCLEIQEYTINQEAEEILAGLYRAKPDVLAFSCYIWNIEYIRELVEDIRKLLPGIKIWLGGPEVSYDAVEELEKLPAADGVIVGEGERTFLELVKHYVNKEPALDRIRGIVYRKLAGDIIENSPAEPVILDEIPFAYEELTDFENRIIYYESSRGCPFSCSYCLSSIDKRLRFRSTGLVIQELQFFLDHRVPQVKFVDRTFNCSHPHAMEIWTYIRDHDQGITNFHFEIAADLLNDEQIGLLKTLRPGLVQLEIGVQSTNPETIQAIHRKMDFGKVSEKVRDIRDAACIHQHLDLIAGLPYEDKESFIRSFNQVYALKPEQLQLGFLKVLKGSAMYREAARHGIIYRSRPPYEVLFTNWLPHEDLLELKGVEQVLETYYNSGQFQRTLEALEEQFTNAYEMYRQLALYYEEKGLDKISRSRLQKYEILLDFASTWDPAGRECYRERLLFDLYLRENVKSRPAWAVDQEPYKKEIRKFYEREARQHHYLKGYEEYDARQLARMTHIEVFYREGKSQVPQLILFDYRNRNPLTNSATVFEIDREQEPESL